MKKIMNKISGFVSGLVSALLCLILIGCSGSANFIDGDNQKRNEVAMIRIPLMVSFESGSATLSAEGIARLDMFMMGSNVSYGDELSMDFPLTREGALSGMNRQRMAFMSEHLKKNGLHLSPDVTPYGARPATNKARFLISRYVVTPPTCGDWSQPSTGNYGNASLPDLGCSNQANLGLMVANPRDLIIGTSNNMPDTESAAKAVHVFRAKPPTKLSKGSNISND